MIITGIIIDIILCRVFFYIDEPAFRQCIRKHLDDSDLAINDNNVLYGCLRIYMKETTHIFLFEVRFATKGPHIALDTLLLLIAKKFITPADFFPLLNHTLRLPIEANRPASKIF